MKNTPNTDCAEVMYISYKMFQCINFVLYYYSENAELLSVGATNLPIARRDINQ